MSTSVVLLGAEQVSSAASSMRDAARSVQQAAGTMEDSLHRHRLWMDDWLYRFEHAAEERDVKRLAKAILHAVRAQPEVRDESAPLTDEVQP